MQLLFVCSGNVKGLGRKRGNGRECGTEGERGGNKKRYVEREVGINLERMEG